MSIILLGEFEHIFKAKKYNVSDLRDTRRREETTEKTNRIRMWHISSWTSWAPYCHCPITMFQLLAAPDTGPSTLHELSFQLTAALG